MLRREIPLRDRALALAPVVWLGLLTLGPGTLGGRLGWGGAALGQALVLAFAALGLGALPDPLRLGRAGRWLPLALLGVVAASLAVSPVPRAGLEVVALLPAWLLAPAAVARCWATAERRRLGLQALALGVGAVLLVGLGRFALGLDGPRLAWPLGHHNPLAAWLVVLAPLAWLGLPTPARRGRRALGLFALGLVSLGASGSLAGGVAAGGQFLALLLARAGRRRWLVVGLLLLLGLALPRALGIVAGRDSSLAARLTYWEAGWRGVEARPALGWGPGSSAWTLGLHWVPRLGVNPPGEAVGQLHAQPLTLAYELGWGGLLLAVGVLGAFAAARLRVGHGEPEVAAGLLGLLGGLLAALPDSELSLPALAAAWAVAAGAALTGGAPRPDGARSVRVAGAVALVLAACALVPARAAHRAYDAARQASSGPEVRRHLEHAVALDPAFPLYGARLAWYGDGIDAAGALRAAEQAPGVGLLWTVAGVAAAQGEERPGRAATLRRALALEPLSPWPPLFLATTSEDPAEGRACAARALLAEPRLAAAEFWAPGFVASLGPELATWPGVEPGLRQAWVAALARPEWADEGRRESLALGAETASGSPSTYLFERLPWAAPWFELPLVASRLAAFELPSAAELPASRPEAFPAAACRTAK